MLVPPLFAVLAYGPFVEAVIILWLASLLYGAHTFLTVVQETAAGCDSVAWPGDLWTEWLASFGYLMALAAAWLGPVCFLVWSGMLDLSGPALVLLVAGLLWLLFPLSLLSSLSASSRLVILRLSVVWRLLRQAPTLLGYYVATALVWLLSLGVFCLAILMARLEPPGVVEIDFSSVLYDWTRWVGLLLLLPFAAVVAAAGLLIYARLLGRLGLVLNLAWHDAPTAPAGQESPVQAAEGALRPVAAELPTRALAPVAFVAGDAEVYPVLAEAPQPARPAHSRTLGAQDVYPALPADSARRQKAALGMRQTVPSRVELRLLRSTDSPPPRWPLWSGVYTFPFYRSNVRPLLTLTLGNLGVGIVLYVIVRWLPF